jgi:hypothetical protein
MKLILEFDPKEAKNAIESGALLAIMEKAAIEENAVRAAVNTVDKPVQQPMAQPTQQPVTPYQQPIQQSITGVPYPGYPTFITGVEQPVTPVQQQPFYPTSMPNTVPQPQPPTGPIQQQMQPVQQPQAPAQQQAPQAVVPTAAAPAYTTDQLAVAATTLVDSGKMDLLRGILNNFGVTALTELPKERYGEFATALRQNGVKI